MNEEKLSFNDISAVLDSLPEAVKSKGSELERKFGRNPLSDTVFRDFLTSLFVTGDIVYPGSDTPHTQIGYFGLFRGTAPEILKKAGRTELKRVYTDLVDLIMSHLEYRSGEVVGFREDEIVDFHHGTVGKGDSVTQVAIPPEYCISYGGMQIIENQVRQLIRAYPAVNVLEQISRDGSLGTLKSDNDLNPEELSIIYTKGSEPRVRIEAGKQLGYSKFRVFAHEHPIVTAVTGIAATGAASGLVHILHQYLSK